MGLSRTGNVKQDNKTLKTSHGFIEYQTKSVSLIQFQTRTETEGHSGLLLQSNTLIKHVTLLQ